MSGVLSLPMLLLIGFCILAEITHEVCLKHAANGSTVREVLSKPMTWLGIVAWAVELIAWMIVLEYVPLSIAFPIMALSYVAIVIAGAGLFQERVDFRHAAGVLLIAAGVTCIGATGL